MADSTLDGDTKIRLTQLGFIVAGVISITALLVSMQHDLATMSRTMTEVVLELRDHDQRLHSIEWQRQK
jgi:hypothetical protein